MKPNKSNLNLNKTLAIACLASLSVFGAMNGRSLAQNAPAQSAAVSLPPGALDALKLSQAGMTEDIIVAKVRGAGNTYNLSVDQIIYLKDQGVSQKVIQSLMPQSGAPASAGTSDAAPAPAPAPAPSSAPSGLASAGNSDAADAPAPAPASAPAPAQAPAPAAYAPSAPAPEDAPAPAATVIVTPVPVVHHSFFGVNVPFVHINAGVDTPAPAVVVAEPAPEPEPAPNLAPPMTVNFDYFHDQLNPYGSWVNVGGNWVWKPSVPAGWQPYMSGGHWSYTDSGWYWQSDYPWGDIAFHYGRWYYSGSQQSWVWSPGYDFAPAWVAWRHSDDGYVAWAPLPPSARFEVGVGLFYNGVVATDVDFGISPNYYVVLGYNHFWDADYSPFLLDFGHRDWFFHHSFVLNGYRMDHGHFFMDGVGRDRMGRFSHHDVRMERMHDLREREEHRNFEARHEDIRHGGHVDATRRADDHGRAGDHNEGRGGHDDGHGGHDAGRPGDHGTPAGHSNTPQTKGAPAKGAPAKGSTSKPSSSSSNDAKK